MTSPFIDAEINTGESIRIPRKFKSYEVTEIIGCGSSAVVLRVKETRSQRTFCAKVLPRPQANAQNLRFIESELRVSLTVTSPNLVQCHEVIYRDDVIIVIMDLCEGGDLLKAATEQRPLVRRQWKKIFRQLLRALKYLHRRGIAHRDVKPENIMVDRLFNVKLCDYGTVCEARDALSDAMCGTLPYIAPEVLRGDEHCSMKADVWAAGITLFAIMTGYFPWRSETHEGMKMEIMGGLTDVRDLACDQAKVILRCCESDPGRRATVEEVLALPELEEDCGRDLRRSTIGKAAYTIHRPGTRTAGQGVVRPAIVRGQQTIRRGHAHARTPEPSRQVRWVNRDGL